MLSLRTRLEIRDAIETASDSWRLVEIRWRWIRDTIETVRDSQRLAETGWKHWRLEALRDW